MQPVILFRKEISFVDEFEIAKKYFNVVEQRCACPANSMVIGRYSVLPYYLELERDVKLLGGQLINSNEQHRWIADFEYYNDLKEYTPESWDDTNFYQCRHPGPFVVKGRTNSRKNRWNSQMFAEDKRKASQIAGELANDLMIGTQGIIYRKYVPLKVFEYGIHDLPFANEWRCFFLGEMMLSFGYYWSSAEKVDYEIPQEALDFANIVAKIAAQHCNFFVLDIAETEAGDWILIEINDGQMSGLSENNPDMLYGNLAKVLHSAESTWSSGSGSLG